MLLLLALTVAIALFAIGCNDTNSENGGATSAPDVTTTGVTTTAGVTEAPESNVRGEGNTEFIFKVVTASGETKTFTVKTDKTTVGEALLDAGLIKGENGQFGLYVTEVDGEYHKYEDDGKYWAFYIDGEYAMTGVSMTPVEDGATYAFKVE